MSPCSLSDILDFTFIAAKNAPPTTGEKVFAGVFFVLFGLIGLGLLRAGLREFFKVSSRRRFLMKLPGTILTVMTERETRSGTVNRRNETAVVLRFIPSVMFHTPEGKRVEFRSEVCDTHHLRRRADGSLQEAPEPTWRSGQTVEVIYDPGGVLKPRIAGGPGLNFMACGMMAAGLLTLGAVIGLGFVFWSKLSR